MLVCLLELSAIDLPLQVRKEFLIAASDIEWLIDRIRTVVKEETGVELQTEVRIVGNAA